MKTKYVILFLNILVAVLSMCWLIYEPSFEPVIAFISSTIILITYDSKIVDGFNSISRKQIAYLSVIIFFITLIFAYLSFDKNTIIGIRGDHNKSNNIRITK